MDTTIQTLIREAVGRDVLYADDFRNNAKTLSLLNQIRGIIKEKEMSISAIEYLKEKRVYQSVESDMRTLEVPPREAFSSLKDYIKDAMNASPLFGFVELSDTDMRELYEAGNAAFQAIARQERILTGAEQDMLVMSTIQLLKSWQPNDEDDSAFWSHIYRQYGYRDDRDEALTNKIYAEFRRAVRDVFSRYNRYIAPSDTHRYYTTLMLHSLSPEQSIKNLFEILIRFFEKNLLLQYVENDTSYRTFVENMKARWDVPEELLRIGLYSAQLSSGLKTLFLNRPYYMAKLSEDIVMRIDELLSQGTVGKGQRTPNYLDTLLAEWFQEKSSILKDEWKSKHSGPGGGRVITQAQFTQSLYILADKKAALFIPSIRLDKTSGDFPIVRLFQDNVMIFEDQLDVYGNELCWTTQKRQITLDETALSFKDRFNIRMEIRFGGEVIFDSKERLFRSLVLFNQSGNESSPSVCKRGTVYLLAGEQTKLESKGLEEGFELPHPGRLFELLAENAQDLRVDGNELFVSEEAKSGFRIYPSKPMVNESWVMHQGNRVAIFKEEFTLAVHLPNGVNRLPYIVMIDQSSKPLSQYCDESTSQFNLAVPGEAWEIHHVHVRDVINSTVASAFNYIIVPGFSVKYDKLLCVFGNAPITGTYRIEETEVPFQSRLNDDLAISLITAYQNTELILQPPVFSCFLAETNIFETELTFWHRDILQDMFLSPSLPAGWSCSLNLDNLPIPPLPGTCKFDIGNYIHSYESKSNKGSLWFSMQNTSGDNVNILAMNVVFRPLFMKSPLIFEEGVLYWKCKDNFYGPKPSNFQVKLSRNGTLFATYSQIGKDEIVEKNLPFKHGFFTFQVLLEGRSLFSSTYEDIYQGEFVIGSQDMLRFTNHLIDLSHAVCWDDKKKISADVPLFENAARVFDIEYIGCSVPSGEDAQYPEYRGNLSFYNYKAGIWQPFNSKESNSNFELVNPIKFWIINDNILVLHSCTDDGLYFDKQRKHILNRDPYRNPSVYPTHDDIAAQTDTPDYFRYIKKELPNAQSN